ncbi:MAG: hypothetical protein ACRD1T_06825 [Acidimicrobiia bacterium]
MNRRHLVLLLSGEKPLLLETPTDPIYAIEDQFEIVLQSLHRRDQWTPSDRPLKDSVDDKQHNQEKVDREDLRATTGVCLPSRDDEGAKLEIWRRAQTVFQRKAPLVEGAEEVLRCLVHSFTLALLTQGEEKVQVRRNL